MNVNLEMSLDRADELLSDLKAEYGKSLQSQSVSPRAIHFTHEICERLRSVLDRVARLYWEKHIAPALQPVDRDKASVYFPIVEKREAFDSVMGRWRWSSIKSQHSAIEQYLLALQPFVDAKNEWLRIVNEMAISSKHIDLVPQKRTEERRVTVSGPGGGGVSYGSGVTFGAGVSIMGAPVDPRTQRIIPTAGVTEKIETWVSFVIDKHNVNALGFCTESCKKTREIATDMAGQFGI